MEINYQETSKDLLTRIDIHEKYVLPISTYGPMICSNPSRHENPRRRLRCWQVMLPLQRIHKKAARQITGGDFSNELLDKALEKNGG